MPARSRIPLVVALLLLGACSGSAPTASPNPAASATATAAQTAAQTASASTAPSASAAPTASATAAATPTGTALPSPTATPFAGPVTNSDGSVWIDRDGGGGFVMAGDDAIWAIFQRPFDGRSVVRIDPATNEMETIIADLPVLPNPITAVGVNGFVWVASWDRGTVTQYDAESGAMIGEHEVGTHPVEPIYAYGDVWTTAIHGNTLARIDVEMAEAQTIVLDPPGAPIGMGVIRDDLAIVGNPRGLPYLINPETMTVVGQFDAGLGTDCLPTFPAGSRIAPVDGTLWVDGCSDEGLTIMDPDTGERLGEVTSPVTADPPLYVDELMWLPFASDSAADHDISIEHGWVGLDSETYEVVAEYQPPSTFTEGYYALGFDSIWMFGHEGILRIPADTLREAASE